MANYHYITVSSVSCHTILANTFAIGSLLVMPVRH